MSWRSDYGLIVNALCLLWILKKAGNMAMVPWLLFTLTMRVAAAFNPMELFLDSKEGVSFAFKVDGVKQYSGEFLLSLMTI